MRQPDAPYLELNFYSADIPETYVLNNLIKALISFGGQFTGKAMAHRGPEIRDKPFASITEKFLEPVTVSNSEDLEQIFLDPNIRLLQILMNKATGTVNDVAEIVTYVSISPEAAHKDKHPLAIWTEGWLFSGTSWFQERYTKQAKMIGKQIYHRFKALIEILRPDYAAITNDYPLECPMDLLSKSHSYAFRDFYISGSYLGFPKLVQLQGLFKGAYIESVGNGIYISSTKQMNPDEKYLETEYTLDLSGKLIELILSANSTK